MECPRCGSLNPVGKKFCGDCGTPLPTRCTGCGAENLSGKKFCGDCGAKLDTDATSLARLSVPKDAQLKHPASSAERRQLTVMFCDLVGSTALSARLDPEDLRDVIAAYHTCVADVVGRYDGFVAKYMGDGVLIYFGYPQAHESDPEQATRAGLVLIEAVDNLATKERLQVRIGIATGTMVVGDLIGSGSAQEQTVIGETPNLAARLQSLAQPGSLVIADSTRQLIGSLFDVVDLGPQELKGLPRAQRAWRVLDENAVESRFEALRSGPTPLIGRTEELELLLRRWTQSKEGEGQVVLLSAEPGIGKSHLAAALRQRIGSEPHTFLQYLCAPHREASALAPIMGQLMRSAGFNRGDAAERKLEKLAALLAPSWPDADDVTLIAELLALPTPERYPALTLDPRQKRSEHLRRCYANIRAWLGNARFLSSLRTCTGLTRHRANFSTSSSTG